MIVPFNIGLSPRGNTHLHDLRAAILVASCKRWAQSQPQWGFTTIPLFCGNEVIYVRGQRNEKPLVMPVVYEQLGRYQISVCIASLNATQFVIRRSLRVIIASINVSYQINLGNGQHLPLRFQDIDHIIMTAASAHYPAFLGNRFEFLVESTGMGWIFVELTGQRSVRTAIEKCRCL